MNLKVVERSLRDGGGYFMQAVRIFQLGRRRLDLCAARSPVVGLQDLLLGCENDAVVL